MIAYKFTGPAGETRGGFRWPLPTADAPGEWEEIPGEGTLTTSVLCSSRVFHACDAGHLLDWVNAELYEIEIDESRGMIVGPDKIGFRRGRLLRRVETWNDRNLRLFACDCAEDVLPFARPQDRPVLEATIAVARRYAEGLATEEERDAAQAAAWDAARAAAGDAAWAAAGNAAWDAAWAAAGNAAWAAAQAAAWDAAGDAAGDAAQAAAWAKYAGWLLDRLGIAA